MPTRAGALAALDAAFASYVQLLFNNLAIASDLMDGDGAAGRRVAAGLRRGRAAHEVMARQILAEFHSNQENVR